MMQWRRYWLPTFIGYALFVAVLGYLNLARDIGRPFGGYLAFYNVIAGKMNLNQQNPVWWSGFTDDRLQELDTLLQIDGRPYTSANEIAAFAQAYETGQPSVTLTIRRDGQQMDIAIPVIPFSPGYYLEIIMPSLLMSLAIGLLAIVIYRAGPNLLLHKVTVLLFCSLIIYVGVRRPSLFSHEGLISRFVDLNNLAFSMPLGVILVHFALVFPDQRQKHRRLIRYGLSLLYAAAIGVSLAYMLSRVLLWQNGRTSLVAWLDKHAFYATWKMALIGVIAVSLRFLWLFLNPRSPRRVRREGLTFLLGLLVALPFIALAIGRPLLGPVPPIFWQHFDLRYLTLALPFAITMMLLRYQTYRRVSPLLIGVPMLALSALISSAGTAVLHTLYPELAQNTADMTGIPPFVIFLAATGGVSLLWSYQASWQSWLGKLLYWERHNYGAVNRFAQKLLHYRQMTQLPFAIADALHDEFQMQHTAVWLWQAAKRQFHLASQTGEWQVAINELPLPSQSTPLQLLQDRQPIYLNLPGRAPASNWLQPLAQSGEQIMVAPLLAGGETIGLLTLKPHWEQPVFTGRDIEIIELIGQQASLFLLTALQIERLQQVPHQITHAQERERFKIAQELHDTTQQFLGRLPFLLEMMYDDAVNGISAEDNTTLQQCLDDVERNARTMRQIRNDLAPAHLDQNFHQALQDLIDRFQAHTALSVQTTIPSHLEALLSTEAKHALYRVVQQALDNIAAHARANKVTLSLTEKKACLYFLIQDDGVGFDLAQRESDKSGEHFGVQSMFARIQAVGGQMTIETAPGQGMHIAGWLPVSDDPPSEN